MPVLNFTFDLRIKSISFHFISELFINNITFDNFLNKSVIQFQILQSQSIIQSRRKIKLILNVHPLADSTQTKSHR